MTTSSQPAALGQYLARHGFAPNLGNPAWLDRDTGQQMIRVLHEPGETTWLYCLDPRGGCLYEARFSPGTPGVVIIAAIKAVFRPPSPWGGQCRTRQATGRRRTQQRNAVTRDDDR